MMLFGWCSLLPLQKMSMSTGLKFLNGQKAFLLSNLYIFFSASSQQIAPKRISRRPGNRNGFRLFHVDF